MAAIETHNLRKRYGQVEALKGVSVRVEHGEIYGLLGQNGAGKTTLIKILLGIVRHWQGEARLLDQRAGTVKTRQKIGYLPEDHRFPPYHTAYSLLNFYGMMLGVSRNDRRQRIPAMLETVGLKDRMYTKIRTYSKGMKQRVGIAQALFHKPELIFLDEPTDGVDPLGRKQIREMLQRLKEGGTTIFLNSHLLSEVELICDRVGILHKGQMIREGSVEALTIQRGFFAIGLAPGQVFPEAELRSLGYAASPLRQSNPQGPTLWEVEIVGEQNIDQVVDFLRGRGLSIRHLLEKRQTLEDLFLKVVREDKTPAATDNSPRPAAADQPAPTSFTDHSQGTDFRR